MDTQQYDVPSAVPVRVSEGEFVFRVGDQPKGWILLVKGQVKVRLVADTGHEIVLYRLRAGDSCLLTTAALFGQERMAAEAVAETEVEARVVPTSAFERLIAQDAEFRRTVLASYSERVIDICLLVQDALFHSLSRRVARLLLQFEQSGEVAMTHREIASELGAAREAVTRVLRRFEGKGFLQGSRGRIRILEAEALRNAVKNEP